VSYLDQWLDPENPALYDSIIYNEESYDTFIWSLQRPYVRSRAVGLRSRFGSLRYLDFACGTGRVLTAVEDLADTSTGIDMAPPMIERARLKSSADFLVADVCDPAQRPTGEFDLITAFRFFLNVDDVTRRAVMNALSAMLRPGGELVFNMHGNKTSSASLVHWRKDAARSDNLMRIGDVRRLVQGAGLKVVAQSGYGLSPRTLYHGRLSNLVRAIDRRLGGPHLSAVSHDVVFVCTK
jgi:SAM-dependent methyltransferase